MISSAQSSVDHLLSDLLKLQLSRPQKTCSIVEPWWQEENLFSWIGFQSIHPNCIGAIWMNIQWPDRGWLVRVKDGPGPDTGHFSSLCLSSVTAPDRVRVCELIWQHPGSPHFPNQTLVHGYAIFHAAYAKYYCRFLTAENTHFLNYLQKLHPKTPFYSTHMTNQMLTW